MTQENGGRPKARARGRARRAAQTEPYVGPWLAAAFFCERVLQETDGTLSAIRIVDRAQMHVIAIDQQGRRATEVDAAILPGTEILQVQALIALRAGSFRGAATLGLRGVASSGKVEDIHTGPIEFVEGHVGVNLMLNIAITVSEPGMHWFDVLLDGRVLTRMPLDITPASAARAHVEAGADQSPQSGAPETQTSTQPTDRGSGR